MDHLSDELIAKILSYLSLNDLVRVNEANKVWLDAVNSLKTTQLALPFQNPLELFMYFQSAENMARVKNTVGGKVKLLIHDVEGPFDDAFLIFMDKCCPSLQKIKIFLPNATINLMDTKLCKQIIELDVSGRSLVLTACNSVYSEIKNKDNLTCPFKIKLKNDLPQCHSGIPYNTVVKEDNKINFSTIYFTPPGDLGQDEYCQHFEITMVKKLNKDELEYKYKIIVSFNENGTNIVVRGDFCSAITLNKAQQ